MVAVEPLIFVVIVSQNYVIPRETRLTLFSRVAKAVAAILVTFSLETDVIVNLAPKSGTDGHLFFLCSATFIGGCSQALVAHDCFLFLFLYAQIHVPSKESEH
jgi:hypothetical protein